MKETDLRVIKTKKALSSSLLQLLEQQLFQTMSDTINNKEDLREIAEFQEEDAEFNKVLKNVCIKIMHNDIKNNRDRIDIDSDIPDNLIFYIYDSLIEGFIHWIKDEKIDWPGEDIDNIFHKVINIKIK